MNKSVSLLAVSLLAAGIAACSGGGGSAELNVPGQLSVAITDAPVNLENVDVYVTFAGVEVKPTSGDSIVFNFDTPQEIKLSDLQGEASEQLLTGVSLDAGEYNWLRLDVISDRNTLDSRLVFSDGSEHSLFVPSGSESGLKLNHHFTVAAGGSTNFTVDFELNKSIVKPTGQPGYYLKPVLRIVDNLEVGTISGDIDASLLAGDNCAEGAMVYAWSGSLDAAGLEDIFVSSADDPARPLTTASVMVDESTGVAVYSYVLGFMEAGDYTLALTCDAELDDPEVDDAPETVGFIDPVINASVTASMTTTADFAAGS